MSSNREWVARCCSLAQTERDIMKQLSNSFDRLGELLTREEREQLTSYTNIFKPTDRSFIQQFHQTSNNIEHIRPHERGFKTRLDNLEKDITTLRVSAAAELEKANGNIRKIADDIDRREKRVIALQTPALRPRPPTQVAFESPVSEFQSFLIKNGGRTGGWDTESHARFLVNLQQHGEADLVSCLSDIPEESVLAHIEWNKEFNRLKARMKAALKEMHQNKESKDVPVDDAPASPKADPEVVRQKIQEREHMKQIRAKQQAEEQEKERLRQEQKRKKKFSQLKQELMRKSNQKPKPIKQMNPEDEIIDNRRSAYNKADWDRIKQRDMAQLKKKEEIKRKQEEARQEREEKQRKLAEANAKKFSHVRRDPERLMKPTAADIARINAEDNDPKGPVNSVFMIPHRATPAWMQ